MSKRVPVSDQVVNLVSEVLEEGYSSAQEIADELSLGRGTVYRALQALDIRLERDGDRTRSIVRTCWEEGLHLDDIAREAGISTAHVYHVMKHLGIEPDFQERLSFNPEPYIIPEPDPVWAAEFRGLFYGEGCTGLEHPSAGGWRPFLIIGLRLDDRSLLEDVYNHLGCHLGNRPGRGNHNPQARWGAWGWARCRAVIEATDLDRGLLPAKKLNDLALVYEAILARYDMPFRYGDEGHSFFSDYHKRIKAVKKYQL